MNWLRVIDITLTSKFGVKYHVSSDSQDGLAIRVKGEKKLSILSDSFTVEIDNLLFSQIAEIINGEFYDISIKAGYKSNGLFEVFKGGILYVSNRYNSDRTYTCIILCAPQSLAKYSQKTMNLTINSGLNAYTMLKILAEDSGVRNIKIDNSLKNIVLNEETRVSGSPMNFIQSWCENKGYIMNADASVAGNEITISNPEKSAERKYKISREQIDISGGYPTISSDGLEFTCLCSFNFSPCDVIQFDNDLIDLSVSNKSDVFKPRTQFIDTNGEYVIYYVSYNLETRGNSFNCTIKARSKTLYKESLGKIAYGSK